MMGIFSSDRLGTGTPASPVALTAVKVMGTLAEAVFPDRPQYVSDLVPMPSDSNSSSHSIRVVANPAVLHSGYSVWQEKLSFYDTKVGPYGHVRSISHLGTFSGEEAKSIVDKYRQNVAQPSEAAPETK